MHVSIANWVKTQDPKLLPKARRFWFKVDTVQGRPKPVRGAGPASKRYEIDMREVSHINSALSDQTDVSSAVALSCNTTPQRCFNGQMLGHPAFLLTEKQRSAIVKQDPLRP